MSTRRLNTSRVRPKPSTVTKGSVVVSSEYRNRKDTLQKTEQREDLEEVALPPGVEPAFVRVGFGKTYNLGNFNSLRVDVAVTMPCAPKDVDKTYKETAQYCADKLAEEESQWLPKGWEE